jgi:hypothetical protein
MLRFLKSFFGSKPTVSPCPEAPYKVEAQQTTVAAVPMSTQYVDGHGDVHEVAPKKKPAARKPAGSTKPAVKAKTTRAKKQAS